VLGAVYCIFSLRKALKPDLEEQYPSQFQNSPVPLRPVIFAKRFVSFRFGDPFGTQRNIILVFANTPVLCRTKPSL
jgi:hypothetical protein